MGAIEIREGCWRKIQFALAVGGHQQPLRQLFQWWQSKSRVLLENARVVKEWVETTLEGDRTGGRHKVYNGKGKKKSFGEYYSSIHSNYLSSSKNANVYGTPTLC